MDYLQIASEIGTIAFAISGIILGIRKDLDILGVMILAFLTCSGGGILRDVLLNQEPAILHNQSIYLLITFMVFICKFLRSKSILSTLEGTFAFRSSDTVGLTAFAISGAQMAMNLGHNIYTMVIMAFLTATGGGIIRDMMVNEFPEILKKRDFYGSVAVIIACGLYGLEHLGIDQSIAIPLMFIIGVTLRIWAILYNIQVPKV